MTELEEYHTLVMMWKLKNYGAPTQMAEKFSWTDENEVITHQSRLQTTASFFRSRGEMRWNLMPENLRQAVKISGF